MPKDSLRLESYGAIDELNSILGLARAFNAEAPRGAARRRLEDILEQLQHELLDLGSELATPPGPGREGAPRVGAEQVARLEHLIDKCQKELEPLRSFILPGGGKVGAVLHQARTVCRRAERRIVRLSRSEELGAWPLRYVNRLSDLFFVLARWVAKHQGEKEHLWKPALRGRRSRSTGK